MFLMLALAVLNYGSRLETLISQTKSKNSKNNLTQIGEASKKNLNKTSNSGQYVAINEASRRILHGLDLRIFLITICLSMLFLVVSVSEFL
jgi:hypothetical protein